MKRLKKMKRMIKPYKILLLFWFMYYCTLAVTGQQNRLLTGNQYFENKEYLLAADAYTKVLSNFAGSAEEQNGIIFKLAESFRLSNNPRRAEGHYLQLIKNKYVEKNSYIYFYYANMLLVQGKYAAAIPVFNQFLVKKPGDQLGLTGKASCELGMKDTPVLSNWNIKNLKEVNSALDDFCPAYGDEKYSSLLFTSSRKGTPLNLNYYWTGGFYSDLFLSKKGKNGLYSPPVPIEAGGIINSKDNEGTAIMTNNYTRIYFTRCEKSEKGFVFCKIMQTTRTGNSWSQPVIIYQDSIGNAGQPAITSDGLTLIFSSGRPDGFGQKDLWKTTRKSLDQAFGRAVNMGALINTPGDDMFPVIYADTLLYFASNGRVGFGGLDLFRVVMKDTIFSRLEHLPQPINSSWDDFGITFAGNTNQGMFTSRRTGGKGGDDIWTFERIKNKISLSGIVKEEVTQKVLPSVAVTMVNSLKDTLKLVTDKSGLISIPGEKLKEGTLYAFTFSKSNYFTAKKELLIDKIEKDSIYKVNVLLQPIPERPIVLPDIYYETNKWELQPQYRDSLNTLVDLLRDNPDIIIELASHTDPRASTSYNDTLSLKRAESVVQFLIQKGIEKTRMIAKGYGKKVPRTLTTTIVRDGFVFPKGTVLSMEFIQGIADPKKREAAYLLNRRTEFKVIRKTK